MPQESTRAPEPKLGDADRPAAQDRRRLLLTMISAGGAALVGFLAGVPFVGFLFSPLRRRGQVWREVGRLEAFAIGQTVKVSLVDPEPELWAGATGQSAAWLRRTGAEEFEAFSIYCSHTGCPVRWDGGSELFLCPCHGGVFYRDGTVAAGPPPAPLERQPVRVRDGVVEVRTIGVPTPTG